MTTYLFSGQGSQIKGMGRELFDDFTDLVEKADELLGYSIKDLCLKNPGNRLVDTQYTQPAIFIVNTLAYLKKISENGETPQYAAGHSLGEYNALFASGVFDFKTGLKLVAKRGELMGKVQGGAMAAVVGLSEKGIKKLLKDNGLNDFFISNYNTPSQFVIAGEKQNIINARHYFEKAGARIYIPLQVSGAFHSPFMAEVENEFSDFIKGFEFKNLSFPVISNVTARPYLADEIKKNLILQITHPVRWTDCVTYLVKKGQKDFHEFGPKKVLTSMIDDIKKEIGNGGSDTTIAKKSEIIAKNTKDQNINHERKVNPELFGSSTYKKAYNLKYAYVAGGMYRGIASTDLVEKMAKAGMMGYFGTGGLDLQTIDEAIQALQERLGNGYVFGMNLLYGPNEDATVDLFLKRNVKHVEAAAYLQITPAIVKYRLRGLARDGDGSIVEKNRIQAKISRPEIAELFLRPAPSRIVEKLVTKGQVTQEQADLSESVPMASDLCVEADSGGHTDQGVAYTLMPVILNLRDRMAAKFNYVSPIHVGAAGGIGTPEAAAAAFILGADFILTGSINQCTVEAGTSIQVKDMLQKINVQDTDYAPAGDMFEMGAKVQVMKKSVFFPARANKLYELYHQFKSIEEMDEKTKKNLEEKYFKRSFEEIYDGVKSYFATHDPKEIEKAERNPKHKMALIFRWYLSYTTDLAITGDETRKVDYQVHCGPALGAFNQWVKGTPLEDWRNRNVDDIARKLMRETADLLQERFLMLSNE